MVAKPIEMPKPHKVKKSGGGRTQHALDGHVVAVSNSGEKDDNGPRECVQGKVVLSELLQQPKLRALIRPLFNLLGRF